MVVNLFFGAQTKRVSRDTPSWNENIELNVKEIISLIVINYLINHCFILFVVE